MASTKQKKLAVRVKELRRTGKAVPAGLAVKLARRQAQPAKG
jgi:hypothetical protein